MPRASIKDIAALAGVSIATVSRTLSNPEVVSEKTRDKVNKAVASAGYKPNRMGASLRTQKSNNIVVIIPDITHPFNAVIIRTIEEEAQKLGYSVLLGDTQSSDSRAKEYAEFVDNGQADGIILFSHVLPFDEGLAAKDWPPIVNSCEIVATDDIYKVSIDNCAAAQLATDYLISLGHKRIAAITGSQNTPSTNERLQGYKNALSESGIHYDPELVFAGDYTLESGVSAAEKLLLRKERPSAIFCFSDDMAIGTIKVLQKNGFNIPKDISVMGFDDIRYSEFITPPLTTIRQPVEEIGRTCVRQLHRLMKGKDAQSTEDLPVQLIMRESTALV